MMLFDLEVVWIQISTSELQKKAFICESHLFNQTKVSPVISRAFTALY